MKKLGCILILAAMICASCQGRIKTAGDPAEFVPAGYVISHEIDGDLNNDGEPDRVLIIKGTDKDKIVQDANRGELDQNCRGILIAFKKGNLYELVLENRSCFTSENEEDGDYLPPELSVRIENDTLFIHYAYGRSGEWSYTFQYQNSDFELIQFDRSENRGSVVERAVSIDFQMKKMLTRENENQATEEGDDEEFTGILEDFILTKPIVLREIVDFYTLYIENMIHRKGPEVYSGEER